MAERNTKPRRKSLKDEWASYAEFVLHGVDPESAQFMESRRAFYMGAASFLHLTMTGLDPGDEPSAADERYLASLNDELLAFNELVKAGKA